MQVNAKLRYMPAGTTLARAWKSTRFMQSLIGPLGSSKTTHNLSKMVHAWTQSPVDPTDNCRHFRWAAVRNTYPDLMTTTIKDFEEICIPLKLGNLTYGSPPTFTADFTGPDGRQVKGELFFLAFDLPKDVKKARGLRLSGAWFNEKKELSKANVDMVMSRLGRFRPDLWRKNPGAWYGALADSNAPPSDHWLAKLAAHPPDNWDVFIQPGAVLLKGGRWVVNPQAENLHNLAPGYYENLMQGKDEYWIRQNLGNEFVHYSDGRAVHPDFNQRLHVAPYELEPVPGVPFSIFDSARTSVIEPGLFSTRSRESIQNVGFHPRDNYLCNALGTHRRVPDLEAVIIPREIGKVRP